MKVEKSPEDRERALMAHDLRQVSGQFDIPGEYLGGGPYGTGHINDTYAVRFEEGGREARYILQRINHEIFKDVPRLMENIQRVVEHVRAKLTAAGGHDPDRETLTIIPARDGGPYYRSPAGNYWRAYIFIEGAQTYDYVESTAQAREAAKAFGRFQLHLMDLPPPRLHDTIPAFHHTPRRFAALEEAIEADVANRAALAKEEIEFALAHKPMTSRLIDLLEAGVLPERVTHNDTKINNVMLDDETGEGVCVIDLDTVMPGLVLYDFGDEIRTTTCTAAEDEKDLSRIQFRTDLFEALVEGYLGSAGDFLVPAEVDQLAFSGRLITFEIGIRFLADFLAGDVYFKTHRPEHNLDRTRTQFALVRAMEDLTDEMEAVVRRYR